MRVKYQSELPLRFVVEEGGDRNCAIGYGYPQWKYFPLISSACKQDHRQPFSCVTRFFQSSPWSIGLKSGSIDYLFPSTGREYEFVKGLAVGLHRVFPNPPIVEQFYVFSECRIRVPSFGPGFCKLSDSDVMWSAVQL